MFDDIIIDKKYKCVGCDQMTDNPLHVCDDCYNKIVDSFADTIIEYEEDDKNV